jgi:hypothetical protein
MVMACNHDIFAEQQFQDFKRRGIALIIAAAFKCQPEKADFGCIQKPALFHQLGAQAIKDVENEYVQPGNS